MPKKFYYRYQVMEGDRWDTIAHRLYGNAGLMTLLMEDNGHIPTCNLEVGEFVFIRQELMSEDVLNTENLPPWRQQNIN